MAHIDETVAVLTEVDYRTGRLHNMAEIERAHHVGALTIWDLAHRWRNQVDLQRLQISRRVHV